MKPTRTAFSLLELLVVLSIMVAVVAVAWPSLRRPIADSALQQAAGGLREQIAICRQSAAIEGQPLLMRFESGQTSVPWGAWNELIAEQLISSSSVEAVSDAGEIENTTLQSMTFPVDIVVDEVKLDSQIDAPQSDSNGPPIATSLDNETSFESGDSLGSMDFEPDSSTLADTESKRWYLPFLPNGQSRDAVIVLRDIATGSRIALQLDATTGMMRTSRLASVEPGSSTSRTEQASLDPPAEVDADSVEMAPSDEGFVP
ncbi:hypothetical protein [Novipirellula aureliae]|uniref:hypothetical protein n=1 Tax=Novipirellula aureliae TaxID=2527966 RepID=UPI0011B83B60|nr:hypothetical protein [Novipirellula aureliae]